MERYTQQAAIHQINQWARTREPFFFVINFDCTLTLLTPLAKWDPRRLQFHFPKVERVATNPQEQIEALYWRSTPPSYTIYQSAFNHLQAQMSRGRSALTNLTFPTPVESNYTLEALFHKSAARYRILVTTDEIRFLSFSPEPFIKIEGNYLYTYPMKGTIDATLPHAQQKLLENPKEQEEHHFATTQAKIDLAKVGSDVSITRYRYIERLNTNKAPILQSSSEVRATLPPSYRDHLGELLFTLLPAGSITGYPKEESLQLIREIEQYQRNFYSGVAGLFDGENLESAVLIRFLEEDPQQGYLFKSGGGITQKSQVADEYQELIQKIYAPIS